MNEFDGFVVYKTDMRPAYIAGHDRYVSISAGAFTELGCPDLVNLFIDESGKRVMIKRAEKKFKNVLRVIEHQAGHNRCICRKDLALTICGIFGKGVRVIGHPAGDGCMIFDRPEAK